MTATKWDLTNEQELIRKYLDDSLSKEEELQVSELYDKDPDFRDALDGLEMMSAPEYTAAMDSIRSRMAGKIRSSANTGSARAESSKGNVRVLYPRASRMRSLAIAASVVLCLAVAGTIMVNQFKSPAARIVASNFEPKPYPDLITRGSGDDLSQPEKMAVSAYNSDNFEVSVKYFEDLFSQYPENEKYGLFLGISHMGLNDHDRAVQILEDIRPKAVKYSDDVNWYLALSYLKTGKIEEAKVLLSGLASKPDSYYSGPSHAILDKLK